jgi:type VI protein secretion system component Hcp
MKIDAHLQLFTQDGGKGTIRGESLDSWYKQQIGITDFSFGDTDGEGDDWLASAGTGSAAAKSFAPFGFEVEKEVDVSSPHLFKAFAVTYSRRKVDAVNFFPSAVVIFRKVGGPSPTVYLTMSFGGVLVTSFSLDIGEDGMSKEKVKFRFQTTTMEYRRQDPTGKLNPPPEKKGWDFEKNKRL